MTQLIERFGKQGWLSSESDRWQRYETIGTRLSRLITLLFGHLPVGLQLYGPMMGNALGAIAMTAIVVLLGKRPPTA